jgi:hypothetical protein
MRCAAGRRQTCFFFATPFISKGSKGHFSQELLASFASYYVTGLANTVTLLEPTLRGIFNPSSIFVQELPEGFLEYSAAKAASEFLCTQIAGRSSGKSMKLAAPRLPRMRTDQTSTVYEAEGDDPVPVMVQALLAYARMPSFT